MELTSYFNKSKPSQCVTLCTPTPFLEVQTALQRRGQGRVVALLIGAWTMQVWAAVMEALAAVPVCGCGFKSPVQQWSQGGSETHRR